jgi:uncharacterized membrane protein
MNKARFEAFSDGVFAFAITLLVLGIVLPPFKDAAPSEGTLAHALLALWPNLLAYGLSFAVIGIMWQNHHALFRLVHTVDRTTVFLNLLLLGVVAFIPFATSTLGAYPRTRPATFLYGLTLTSSATAYNLLLAHLVRSGAFAGDVGAATIRQTIVAYRVGWATYTTAMLVSLVAPVLSFALYLLVAAYYLVPRGVDTDLARPTGPRDRAGPPRAGA